MQPLLPGPKLLLRASLSLGENFVTDWKIAGTVAAFSIVCSRYRTEPGGRAPV